MITQRLAGLEAHLKQENPILLEVIKHFRALDEIAYRTGLLDTEQSFATRIAWWPLIAVLGTFSAGKSTFINHYLGRKLQHTGNQAVDDKFTVMCFSAEDRDRTLPGLALDADPRFPFYKISRELEKVAVGEGRRIDAYLQLKTCPRESLRGKILIDSPGFDADAQRTSTLRITDHIIDLSDLVLVFFDARHPEPGAMRDTLQHLVGDTINRHDSNKFLYILNQLDTSAREDNPEAVVAAWQRSLAQQGLTAGRFYGIYNPDAAMPIADPALRQRYEAKRDHDLAEINRRMQHIEIDRAYRIVGALQTTAEAIAQRDIPRLRALLAAWRRGVLRWDAALLGLTLAAVGLAAFGFWPDQVHRWWALSGGADIGLAAAAVVWLVIAVGAHYRVRGWVAARIAARLDREMSAGPARDAIQRAFKRSTGRWRSIFQREPAGWGRAGRRAIAQVLNAAHTGVQRLNDEFTNPSGVAGVGGVRTPYCHSPPSEDRRGEL